METPCSDASNDGSPEGSTASKSIVDSDGKEDLNAVLNDVATPLTNNSRCRQSQSNDDANNSSSKLVEDIASIKKGTIMRPYPMNIASPPFDLFLCLAVIIFLSTTVDTFWKEYLHKI